MEGGAANFWILRQRFVGMVGYDGCCSEVVIWRCWGEMINCIPCREMR